MMFRTRASRGPVALLLIGLALSACGGPATPAGNAAMSGMPGMSEPMPPGNGASDRSLGYTLVPATGTEPAGAPSTYAFHITGPDGKPVTLFEPDQTKPLHLYLIRSDLSGFHHLHPAMAADGTWSIGLPALPAGTYRAYATFTTRDARGAAMAFVLSHQLTVPGAVANVPVPAPAPTADVDGYTLTLGGRPSMNVDRPLTLTVERAGRPVTDLQPYLDAYAHLSAFHAGDPAFAHLHPRGGVAGDHGGPTLSFDARFPLAGQWRLYVQFQTSGTLHTAAFTVSVG